MQGTNNTLSVVLFRHVTVPTQQLEFIPSLSSLKLAENISKDSGTCTEFLSMFFSIIFNVIYGKKPFLSNSATSTFSSQKKKNFFSQFTVVMPSHGFRFSSAQFQQISKMMLFPRHRCTPVFKLPTRVMLLSSGCAFPPIIESIT